MSAKYILTYVENTDSSDPIDSLRIRPFASLFNARAAMEDAFDKTDAIMRYSEMETDDEHYVDRAPNSITVRCGMDSMRWTIFEVGAPEDPESQFRANWSYGKRHRFGLCFGL